MSHEVGELIATLEAELNNANRLGKNGIGLAAPQIGLGKDIAIIRLGEGLNLNLINCKIENGYDPVMFRGEGCLSFPGRIEDTIRYQEVHISSNLVEPHSFIARGFLAIAIQHEIDHLNSTLFMDRIAPQNNTSLKIDRNDLCPCNSGIKYKKCCGK